MIVKTEPRVYLVSRPSVDWEQIAAFLSDERLPPRSRDGSVFEHVNYGFVITGVSRSLSHELVRHRAGFAYSQCSQRYVDESEGSFIIPPQGGETGGALHSSQCRRDKDVRNGQRPRMETLHRDARLTIRRRRDQKAGADDTGTP